MSQGDGFVESSTATPCNTKLSRFRNNVVAEGGGFGLEPRNVENEEKSLNRPLKKDNEEQSLKRPLKKEKES